MRHLALLGLWALLVAVIAAAGIYALYPRPETPRPAEEAAPPAPAPTSPQHTEPEAPPFPTTSRTDLDYAYPPPLELPPLPQVPQRRYTLSEKLDEISPAARPRIVEKFKSADVKWPPREVALVALKDENILELHARRFGKPWKLVHRYPIHKASGGPGPKLREGDRQVPEGMYRVIFLNPNSRYHVSLRLDYPNSFDQRMGARDGRTTLGGDIMIHGKALSVGCLAMGDEAAEELFVLAAAVLPRGKAEPRMRVIIAPTDFRKIAPATPPPTGSPPWLTGLYADITREMATFKSEL